MNLQVPVAELRKNKLFVATPMYGGQCFGSYTKSILDLSRVCANYGIPVQFSFLFNESLITRARNYLVDEFMRSGFTHLMFIDSDIDFDAEDVVKLLAINKPIIGGPYPKKCIAWENVYDAVRYGFVPNDNRGALADFAGDFVFNGAPGTTQMALNEPAEVLEIGTGFMLTRREVFEKFAAAYPDNWYNPDHNRSAAFDGSRKIYQYFQAEIERKHNRYLSEDYWFCQKAREMGESVWLAPWMKIRHHGTYIYGGDIPAMATVMNERQKRNDPVPAVVRIDGSKATETPAVPVAPKKQTVKMFSDQATTLRKKQFTEWAEKFGVQEAALVAAYKASYEEWLKTVPDLPILEKIEEMVKTNESLKRYTETPVEPVITEPQS